MKTQHDQDRIEPISLESSVGFTLEEARMVLPGIQTLFGFQLVAVFSPRFDVVLNHTDQLIYLTCLLLIGLACALVMAPAAHHRIAEVDCVSTHLLKSASFMVGAGLVPLVLAIAGDVYLVAKVIVDHHVIAVILGLSCIAIFAFLWLACPLWLRRKERRCRVLPHA